MSTRLFQVLLRHPVLYAAAVGGTGGTAVYAGLRARAARSRARRMAFAALAVHATTHLVTVVRETERLRRQHACAPLT